MCFFDCLHDMGDPVGALRNVKGALAPGGTIMLVEPMAGDTVDDNVNPVGAAYYASRPCCAPRARAARRSGPPWAPRPARPASREVAAEAGITQFRRVAETPFNMVLELRP